MRIWIFISGLKGLNLTVLHTNIFPYGNWFLIVIAGGTLLCSPALELTKLQRDKKS